MQAKVAIGIMVLMFAALLAGPKEASNVAEITLPAKTLSDAERDALIDDVPPADEGMVAVCEVLDEGFIRPIDMDWVLTRSEPLFSPDLVSAIRRHAALLEQRDATHRAHCSAIEDAGRREQCIVQRPAAFMARVFESLSMAIDGQEWAATPFGALDLERWQLAGRRDRSTNLMFDYCVDALLSLDEPLDTLQARVR